VKASEESIFTGAVRARWVARLARDFAYVGGEMLDLLGERRPERVGHDGGLCPEGEVVSRRRSAHPTG
jgi:hypothetical protein